MAGGVEIPPDSPSAVAWNNVLNWTWVVETAIDLLLPLWLLLSGWGSRLARLSERWSSRRRYLAWIIFALIYMLIRFVLRLPVEFGRHLAYPGRDADTALAWLTGQLQSLLLPVLAALLLLWLPLLLIRKSPQRWWLWLTGITAPIALVVLIGQPLWMSAGKGYKPLENGALRSAIVTMASACGIPHIQIVVGGDDTSVYGLGPTNRVILQSDLLKVESPDQVRFTVAHELKHYVLGDNWKALAIIVAFVLVASWIVDRAARWVFSRHGERIDCRELSDVRAFPLVLFSVMALCVVIEPGFLAFNRHIEREADRFGLELSHENVAAAALFKGWLGGLEMADPGVFAKLTRSTHPSLAERIRMAQNYHPWESGEALKYDAVCRANSSQLSK
ncbi:M48 family metalloprotease [Dyella choica]|nr:M48 family metalloprotease [Dyella choica]